MNTQLNIAQLIQNFTRDLGSIDIASSVVSHYVDLVAYYRTQGVDAIQANQKAWADLTQSLIFLQQAFNQLQTGGVTENQFRQVAGSR